MSLRQWAGAILVAVLATQAAARPPPAAAARLHEVRRSRPPTLVDRVVRLDHSGRVQKGRASFYAECFDNRTMADGTRFDPNANTAASKTLPLGTTAKLTNLQNGKSAVVKVADRGPWISGRIVDVTPKIATELDIRSRGVAQVVVAPIAVPQSDGAVKLGAGAAEVTAQELEIALQETTAAGRPPTAARAPQPHQASRPAPGPAYGSR